LPVILEHWKFVAAESSVTSVLPDGCRDLIIKQSKGCAPICFISDLANSFDQVEMQAGDCFNGFRLQPGARINADGLLGAIADGQTDAQIKERLHDFVTQTPNVSEALACLSGGITNVAQAAADLGVQPRSLQRLLKQQTQKTPAFWLRLAKARKAVLRITPFSNLADLSYDLGFADQPHMTREFRHWFGVTPRKVKTDTGWKTQNLRLGYGA